MGLFKPDAPKPPDYGPLAEASKESAQYAYQLAQEQQAWAKQVYEENKVVSDEVVDFALGQMERQDQWAQADRARYESIYQPLEEQLAKEAEDYSTLERQEMEAGKAEADVAQQFDQARQAAQDRLESFGVDPSQTRAGALDLQTRIAEAAAQSSAGNQARTQTENIGRALRSEAINVGKGYPGQIAGSAAGAGQSGNQAVNTGLAQTASGAQTQGTGYQWQGLGNQGVGQWGNILNAGFNNALDKYKAESQASSGIGGFLGTIAPIAGKAAFPGFFQEGGAIPDPMAEGGVPVPEEASPSSGAIPDDVDATMPNGGPAQLNAGEFIVPKDVVSWLGEKGMQQVILKARKEMTGQNGERPAQPSSEPPPPQYDGAGAIPMPQGA